MAFLTSNYFIYSLTFILVYSAIAVVLHIQFSMAGISNFGLAGIWGLGMYVCAILNVTLEMPFILALILSVIITSLVSLVLGAVILDLDDQSVLVGTLAFATIVEDLATTEKWLTNGVRGFGTISYPFKYGTKTSTVWMYIILALLVLLIIYTFKMKKSPYGRMLQSIKDNEQLSRSLGKATKKNKIIIFVLTSAILALFGAMTAPVYNFIFPRMISSSVTFVAWIALMLGGRLRVMGGVVGVFATVGVFDVLVETVITIPQQYAPIVPNIKYTVYGLMLMLVLMFRPLGILGSNRKKAVRTQ